MQEKMIAELEEVKLRIEAFFDPEGNPPEDTGEFRELKGAIKMLEYVIRALDDSRHAEQEDGLREAILAKIDERNKEPMINKDFSAGMISLSGSMIKVVFAYTHPIPEAKPEAEALAKHYKCPRCHTRFTREYPYKPSDTKEEDGGAK